MLYVRPTYAVCTQMYWVTCLVTNHYDPSHPFFCFSRCGGDIIDRIHHREAHATHWHRTRGTAARTHTHSRAGFPGFRREALEDARLLFLEMYAWLVSEKLCEQIVIIITNKLRDE